MRRRVTLRGLRARTALVTAVLVLGPPALASGQQSSVECAADADDGGVYLAHPGEVLTCTAHGLDPTLDTDWEVTFLDWKKEVVLGDPVSGSVPAGTATFGFLVPDAQLALDGRVIQRVGDEEVYVETFSGTTDWFLIGRLSCGPEPVQVGGTVECVAEELVPGGFEWCVVFHDGFDGLEAVAGGGTLDHAGVGTFTFDVPSDIAGIAGYTAIAEQRNAEAKATGTVVPSGDVRVPAPVAVPHPTRIDTGGGGTAATGGWSDAAGATALAVALGALGIRRRCRPGAGRGRW